MLGAPGSPVRARRWPAFSFEGHCMLAKLLLTSFRLGLVRLAFAQGRPGHGGGGGRGGGRGGGDDSGAMLRMPARQTKGGNSSAQQTRLEQGATGRDPKTSDCRVAGCRADPRSKWRTPACRLRGLSLRARAKTRSTRPRRLTRQRQSILPTLRVKVFAEIYATLKPKQQAKAEQGFEVLSGIFTTQSSGGGGGGRGMGRGGMSGRGGQGR